MKGRPKQDEEGVFAEGVHDEERQLVWEALFSYTTLSQNRLMAAQKQLQSHCRESSCRYLGSGCSNNDRLWDTIGALNRRF